MIYSEDQIDFGVISDTLFEELCFDLLKRHGFTSLQWRQGGADQGRDIQGEFTSPNSLVESYKETWFFECKNYSGGVPPDKLESKFTWANANKIDHLVFFMASYPTNPCRDWLEKKKEQVSYKVHIIEGKHLKILLLQYPDLIERYFIDKKGRLFRNSFVDWIISGIFPDVKRLSVFFNELKLDRLTEAEIAFLLMAIIEKSEEIEASDERGRGLWDEKVVEIIKKLALSAEVSVIIDLDIISIDKVDSSVPYICMSYKKSSNTYKGHFIQFATSYNRLTAYEVLLGRTMPSGNYEVDIRLLSADTGNPTDISRFLSEWYSKHPPDFGW